VTRPATCTPSAPAMSPYANNPDPKQQGFLVVGNCVLW
jgi:hypothetical protein